MARNGSGTFTIPNTMVSGATITASGHNQNYSDIASELTNSVAADGQTTMTGPLKSANGSAAAPSISFASDTDSGWYRKAANSLALTLEGVDRVVFTTASATFSCAVTISNEFIASATSTFILTANFSTKPVVPAKSFAISKIADGTVNVLYGTDGSGVATEVTLGNGLTLSAASLSATAQLPRGYIDGCVLSNGTDTTNDINITAGSCRDSTNAFNIDVSANTSGKQLDANWAASGTTNSGMRNSAVGIANGTYHIYAARTAASSAATIYAYAGVAGTDPDSAASISTVITALNAEGGSTYVYARRIGSILRESGSIVQFVQVGDEIIRTTPVLDFSANNPGTSAVTRTLKVPLGVKVWAKFRGGVLDTASNGFFHFSAMDQADLAPSATAAPLSHGIYNSATVASTYEFNLRTDNSGQIRSRIDHSGAGTTMYVSTQSWTDRRGKDN